MLTMALLPLLHKSIPGGRIVVLTSGVHYTSDEIRYDQIIFSSYYQKKHIYSRQEAYAQSKLANVLFVKALTRRLEQVSSKVTINAVHPGTCPSNPHHHHYFTGSWRCNWVPRALGATSMMDRFLTMTPEEGAMAPIIWLWPRKWRVFRASTFLIFDQDPQTPSRSMEDECTEHWVGFQSIV